MNRIIVFVFLVFILLGSQAMSETAVDWFNRADELWDGKKFINPKKAVDYLSKAIQAQPNYANAYIQRGMAYIELGSYQSAIQDYNQALLFTTDPNSLAKISDKAGVAYAHLGQYKKAIDGFNKAISLKPDYPDAYNNRGIVYFLQDNKKQGCLDAQKACALGNCELLQLSKTKGFCR